MRAWRPWLVLELHTRLALHCRFSLSLSSLSTHTQCFALLSLSSRLHTDKLSVENSFCLSVDRESLFLSLMSLPARTFLVGLF